MRVMLLAALLPSLCGCMVKAKTVTRYDDECEIGFRKMVLTAEQIPLFEECVKFSCADAVFGGLLVTSASAIVSGSIVLAGNTVYWLQKQGRCERAVEQLEARAETTTAPAIP